MVADQNECIGHPERTEAGGQGNLRSFIDYTVIEFSAEEEWTRCQQISLKQYEKPQTTYWSIERQVAATTGGLINRESNWPILVDGGNASNVIHFTEG